LPKFIWNSLQSASRFTLSGYVAVLGARNNSTRIPPESPNRGYLRIPHTRIPGNTRNFDPAGGEKSKNYREMLPVTWPIEITV
ncbi:hypothetical protein ACIPVK_18155, partial [Paeniglutamicibacter sp. MACA_103]|uniref:hypothetical protein n=1 Tax=Paeniglutamicibacter sp. MACA_103 TaxID=3377337 RepID=UPI00389535D4